MSRATLLAGLVLLRAASAPAGEPYFVDLTKVANASLEDDGVAGNGQGGWTDEGINDMFLYPPLPRGTFRRNGYPFHVIEPKSNDGRSIIRLAGERLTIESPRSVTIPVGGRKAKHLYFLQSSALSVSKLPKNYTVATYTLTYDDGATAELAVRDGIEIRPWWSKAWFDNSGAKSWPIHMGRNLYSMKWKFFIGVWAMQWANPHPDKAIRSIALKSAGKAVAIVFAVTLSDQDYYKGKDLKKDYKRPPDVPAGYFDRKQAIENARLFGEMVKAGHVRGLRRVDVIRSDLLAVTVDAGWAKGGAGPGEAAARKRQTPDHFAIASADDPAFAATRHPTRVGRFSFERWNGDIGPFPANILYWHTYYLFLAKPMEAGKTYTVSLKDMDARFEGKARLAYDRAQTVTPVIKVNQVAYSSRASRRYAYLGWWAGDAGAVDYAGLSAFRAIDEATGKPAIEGKIALRAKADALSGEDVYEMDLSALKPGRYHLEVPGLGRSDSFDVGGKGLDALYRATARAFYHQRCGIALEKPYTTFTRPACHTAVYRSGRLVGAKDYAPKPNEPIRRFKYGYHDAADYDCFTYHLRATAQVLTAYTMFPRHFGDDLNIPESGNGVPDVLDEADWALRGYLELQRPDGAVPLGRGNDQDYIRGLRRGGQDPEYGILPPEASSSAEYAAVAAQYARIIRPQNARRAEEYLASARRALDWALAHPDVGPHDKRGYGKLFTMWAAAEMFRATGEPRFSDAFLAMHKQDVLRKAHWSAGGVKPTVMWPYAACTRPAADKAVQEELRKLLIRSADHVVKQTPLPAYRMGVGVKDRGLGWGNANGGGRYGDVCLRAWKLTGKQAYLDAACLNADFQLGANPLSQSLITGMGARPPRQPQISPFLYTHPNKTGKTVAGIAIYGISARGVAWYPSAVPVWRRYRDLGNGGAEVCSEFTVTETLGAAAMLYAVLDAIETTHAPAPR